MAKKGQKIKEIQIQEEQDLETEGPKAWEMLWNKEGLKEGVQMEEKGIETKLSNPVLDEDLESEFQRKWRHQKENRSYYRGLDLKSLALEVQEEFKEKIAGKELRILGRIFMGQELEREYAINPQGVRVHGVKVVLKKGVSLKSRLGEVTYRARDRKEYVSMWMKWFLMDESPAIGMTNEWQWDGEGKTAKEIAKASWEWIHEHQDIFLEMKSKKLWLHCLNRYGKEWSQGMLEGMQEWKHKRLLKGGVAGRNNEEMVAWGVWSWGADALLKSKLLSAEDQKIWETAKCWIDHKIKECNAKKEWTLKDEQRRVYAAEWLKGDDIELVSNNVEIARLTKEDINWRRGGNKKNLGVTILQEVAGSSRGPGIEWLLKQGANPWMIQLGRYESPIQWIMDTTRWRVTENRGGLIERWIESMQKEELEDHEGWVEELEKAMEHKTGWIENLRQEEYDLLKGALQKVIFDGVLKASEAKQEGHEEEKALEGLDIKNRQDPRDQEIEGLERKPRRL